MSLISWVKTYAAGDILKATDLESDKASITTVVNGDIEDVNIKAAANIASSKIGDFSANAAEMQADTVPLSGGSPVLATTIVGELRGLRAMIRLITGGTYWYSKAEAGTGPIIGPAWRTGDLRLTTRATADGGWVLLNDGTIGDASSGASNRANADTADLFAHLWDTYDDTLAPVSSGRGASAAADYAAHKTLRLPLSVARQLGVSGTPASANVIESLTGTMGITGTCPVDGDSTTVFYIQRERSSKVDDDYNTYIIRFTSGALSGTEKTISDYDGGDHKVTVSVAFGSTPSAGDTYVIYPAAAQTTLALLPFEQWSAKDDVYNSYTIETTGGTGSGQTRTISDYDGSKRLVTISAVWTTQPDYTTTFSIYKTIATRTSAQKIGTDLIIPTIDNSAEHTHSGRMGLGASGTGHLDEEILPGGVAAATTYTSTDAVLPTLGNNSTISNYAPTVFYPVQIKL